MRAALRDGPVRVVPHDEAFERYLSDHDLHANDRALRRTLARVGLRRAMAHDSMLTTTGYGIAWQLYKTNAEARAASVQLRADLLDDWSADQFELASLYLSQLEPRKSLNRDYSTYNLKHQAERLSRERGIATHLGNYVCNGVFIAAALSAGFHVRQIDWSSLNGFINATTRSIKAARTGQLINRSTMSALWRLVTAPDPEVSEAA
ncbi:hypothetical protein [Caulobacter sp. FWC2]|uniref:hypothetical protein n=1 Tax=Caulobacter sp. FWC2 TaxID=69664 RepID=UPI001177818C|nr:hypothetical protein [Caulobacter sp. FWC2]